MPCTARVHLCRGRTHNWAHEWVRVHLSASLVMLHYPSASSKVCHDFLMKSRAPIHSFRTLEKSHCRLPCTPLPLHTMWSTCNHFPTAMPLLCRCYPVTCFTGGGLSNGTGGGRCRRGPANSAAIVTSHAFTHVLDAGTHIPDTLNDGHLAGCSADGFCFLFGGG